MRSVTEYLDRIVTICPEKTAFRDENSEITFAELQRKSLLTAAPLIRLGLRRQPVLIFLEKSTEAIAAFFGAAYSGNFYTPVDTKMPEERLKKIIRTLSPAAVITDLLHKDQVYGLLEGIPVFFMEELASGQVEENLVQKSVERILETDTLYVLFTSGSTGEPKGVVISHRAVIHYTNWITSQFGITEDDVIGNEAPLYFDLSIQDVYAPVCTGCTTVLIGRKRFSFPTSLMGYLTDQKVTMIMWVPSMLCLVANLKGLRVKKKPKIDKIFFCGEVMPNKQLNEWRKAYPDAKVVNFYGPTEACDACGYYVVDREFRDDEPLPIGFAAPNVELFLLDEEDRRIEEKDRTGELCIRGVPLSNGYYRDPERTKESFVQNPLQSAFPEVIYRTGDLACYNERGELMYVSRKDFQIKHLGHRIELGEIETAASAAEGVESCCCVYDEKKQRIVLFYTGGAEEGTLGKELSGRLPQYMLPAERIPLRKMPLNANGKIDRNALKGEVNGN